MGSTTKRLKEISIAMLLLALSLAAMPDNNTNIVKDKTEIDSIELTSLNNPDKLFDGVISSKPEFSATASANLNQNIILKLKHPFYLRELKIFTDKIEAPGGVIIRYSKNALFWFELEDVRKTEENNSLVYTINGDNVLAQYIAVVLRDNPKTAQIRLQELEIYPEMDIRLKSRHVKDNWLCTDKEAFDDIDTKIDTVKYMRFSEVGVPEDGKFKRIPSPVLEGEAISVGNLLPGTAYDYKMSITDYNGNMLEVEPRRFNTLPESLTLHRSTEGTFTRRYDGSSIPNGEYPLTDGTTDLDKGFALSASLKDADQYVIVDLGANKNLSEVVLLWRALGYSKDYSIQLSSDKQNWTTVAEHQNADTAISARSAEGHPLKAVFSKFNRTSARYIKVFMAKGSDHYSKHGTSEMELFEVKAF